MDQKASALRFDGKVAVVTGAGLGLGRTFALHLAARGAKVVVNDLGSSHTGTGSSTRVADDVVAEIKAKGGIAVANYDSVENGAAVIQSAIDAFGRVDILINNAGVLRDVSFVKMTEDDWDVVYRVHLKGTFSCCKAAWSHMRRQNYGRIINISSASGIYGNFGQANYSAMKMGIVGLSNTLSREGAKHGIRVNTIAPTAGTRMTATIMPQDILQSLRPEYVANTVLFLVHESCQENGQLFELGAGWVGKLRWERSQGIFFRLDNSFSPETVRDRWPEINDWRDATHPSSSQDSFQPIMRSIQSPLDIPSRRVSPLKAEQIFTKIGEFARAKRTELKKTLTSPIEVLVNGTDAWMVDVNGEGEAVRKCAKGEEKGKNAALLLAMGDDDLAEIADGKATVSKVFAKGHLKVQGDLKLALKLEPLIRRAMAFQGSKL